jgi:hypothetical protein
VAEIFPCIESPHFGCKVPQVAKLLKVEGRISHVQKSVKHLDFPSLQKLGEWKGLHKWDWKCYGQIDPGKASVYWECVICPLHQNVLKPTEPYAFSCQGLAELGKHATSQRHQAAAAWVEGRKKKPVLRMPKPSQC